MSRYPLFPTDELELRSWHERGHDLKAEDCLPLAPAAEPIAHPDWPCLVSAVEEARRLGKPVILMMGAHVVKLGLNRFLIDLMARGWVTHVATNGAGLIHDYELATGGGTSEDVARWIRAGQFGLWKETSRLNDVINEACRRGEGLGEGIGRYLEGAACPHRDVSLSAAGYRLGIPVTAHVSIGSDIIHAHHNADGAALGETSLRDFLILAESLRSLEGGVFLNVGSAVTGPEVYLKALAMVRNVARREGGEVRRFTTAVMDLVPLPDNFRDGVPGKEHPLYYYRPWKTILVRTVADGGTSYYFAGDHRQTIPSLWHRLVTVARQPPVRPGAAA